jgi:hypothetical protein
MTMNANFEPLLELWARITELEEEISNRAKWKRLLDTLKKLFTEAQDHHCKGNMQEARLTLNSAFRLVERTKSELKKQDRFSYPA